MLKLFLGGFLIVIGVGVATLIMTALWYLFLGCCISFTGGALMAIGRSELP